MAEGIRFHLDEHVNPRIAYALRRRGIDATTTVEADLRTTDDTIQWKFAQQEQRVIVTCDADFLESNLTGDNHAGIVYFPKNQRSIGDVVEWLMLIHGAMTPEDMHRHLEFVPTRN